MRDFALDAHAVYASTQIRADTAHVDFALAFAFALALAFVFALALAFALAFALAIANAAGYFGIIWMNGSWEIIPVSS